MPARPWWRRRLAIPLIAALLVAATLYGRQTVDLGLSLLAREFAYYDNSRRVVAHIRDLPVGAGKPDGDYVPWPERVLRPACRFTLNLMGCRGPEGEEWTASMDGPALVITAAWAPVEIGRYRLVSGMEERGLVVVELDAGPNGLFLMSVAEPKAGAGWYVVRVYNTVDGLHLPWTSGD